MAKKFREKLRKLNPFTRPATLEELPKPLPANPDQRLVKVYVEGYEDVAFWRGIFDHFQNPYLRFEISVPDRGDLPKGKKVLMGMIPRSSEELLLCVDSDFDYLFAGRTPQSKEVAEAKFMFHTYAYATENYLCYAPSLHNVCVKATKNDTRIFDFVKFMHEYSCTIYPLFLWYAYSAQLAKFAGSYSKKTGRLTATGARRVMNKKPLIGETRQLSTTIYKRVDGNTLTVGSPMAYAAIHQWGGKAGRKKKVTIPSRKFMPIDDTGNLAPQARRLALAELEDYLKP